MDTASITKTKRPGNDNDQIIPYYTLRVLIGAAGISLPFLLWIGKLIFRNSFQIEYSISDYYDDGTAGDILVGVLFALAFFLVSYRGYAPIDSIAANLGCAFALGVALCPTTSDNKIVHILHFVFALLLFSVFIFFSIYLFRKKSPHPTKQKKNRNKVYLTCGILMIICIAGIAVYQIFDLNSSWHPVFWLESLALISFGFSWITKAEVLFED
jgi:quinol-cytochrome oxidoreductase complex cytochrome b subunit